jgi:nitroreductase
MFSDLIRERYSVREYSRKPVEEEKLRAVLEAGRLAPTAKNAQPQRIYAVKSGDMLEKLRSVCGMTFDAPAVIVICADLSASFVSPFSGRNLGETDAAIVTDHMMLQAADLGLGTCWVGWFDPAEIKKALGIPENLEVMNLLPIGYPSENSKPSPRHGDRKPLEETVTEIRAPAFPAYGTAGI